MLDVQRKRLRHLMANAILELWKKETGSLSSVIIEGTICITAGGGHTIVVQVEDHFHGVLPDRYEQDVYGYNALGYKTKSLATESSKAVTDGERYREERVLEVDRSVEHSGSMDLSQSGVHVSSVGSSTYQGDVSSASTTSPDRESLRQEPPRTERKDTVTSRTDSTDQEVFYPEQKETSPVSQESSADSDSDIEIDATDDVEPYIPRPSAEQNGLQKRSESFCVPADELSSSGYSSTLGRSFYSSLSKSQSSGISELKSPDNIFTPYKEKTSITPLRRRSASPTLLKGSPSMSTSTPKDFLKRPRLESDRTAAATPSGPVEVDRHRVKTEPDDPVWSHHTLGTPMSKSGSVLDLSYRRDHDLALSPPQNYTAQVRHVIRQRLLANRHSSSAIDDESPRDHGNGKEGEETPAPLSSSASLNTSTTVTVDTATPTLPFFYGLTPCMAPSGDKESWSEKLPQMPLSGPASWPVASQEKSPSLGDSKFFLPGHFSPLLSVGVHGMPPLLPSSMSPAMFPSAFSPGFPPRLPLPPGISLQDLANLSKSQLISPQTPLTPMAPHAVPGPPHRDDDTRSYSTQASGRSTPEVTDINGNSTEKDVSTNGGDQKVYVCEYCNKHFLFKSKYHEHLPVHTNARPYQCHLCSRTYKYKYDLQVHLRTHMGIPTKSTICPFCSGKFLTNKMLRNHIVEAHQDRQKVSKEECTQPVDNLPPAL